MSAELRHTLQIVDRGGLQAFPRYANLPPELLELRHVALSGDGEPTLSPRFADVVEAVVHLRAVGRLPFFKIVLITNASGLDKPEVHQSLRYFTGQDEIWAKLDAGTQAYLTRVNRTTVPLSHILSNILLVARERPVIIQSLFPSVHGTEPPAAEIEQFALRLKELKDQGARIPLVQIYSATRPTPHSECGHLPLRSLSRIAGVVRSVSGLKAEVF